MKPESISGPIGLGSGSRPLPHTHSTFLSDVSLPRWWPLRYQISEKVTTAIASMLSCVKPLVCLPKRSFISFAEVNHFGNRFALLCWSQWMWVKHFCRSSFLVFSTLNFLQYPINFPRVMCERISVAKWKDLWFPDSTEMTVWWSEYMNRDGGKGKLTGYRLQYSGDQD